MKPVWTLDQVVAQLTNWQARWNNSIPIPYLLYAQPLPHHDFQLGFSPFNQAELQSLQHTMQLISDVANLSFVNIADSGQAATFSNPFIGFYTVNTSTAPFWGAATDYLTQNADIPYGAIYGVDIVVNHYRSNVQGGWGIGDSNSRKLMHEVLHALGLDHPGPYNGDTANYESQALFFQDSHQYTVMSYWNAVNSGADHVSGSTLQWTSTPLLYDVAALQSLYGANMTTRTGHTVYGFNNKSGRAAYDLARDPASIFTIWDAGGTDTLDLSGYSSPSRIDLGQGAFSDSGEMTANISIAFGAIIENAIGGAGDDSLTGNEARNRLEGNGGADVLKGGADSDWLVGGAGGDTFVYASYSDSDLPLLRSDGKKVASDYLADFTSGVDRIDLSALDAIPSTAANDAFAFIGSAAFAGVAGQLRFEVRHGQLWLEGDIDGNGVCDFSIAMKAAAIVAADLIL